MQRLLPTVHAVEISQVKEAHKTPWLVSVSDLKDGAICQNISQKFLFTATKHSGVKNGRFGPSSNPRPVKNRDAKGQNLHTSPTFVHVFCSNFAAFRVSVSTPNFQKSTPNFQKSLTFFSQRAPFLLKSNQPTDNQPFRKPLKNTFFSSKSVFVENYWNMEA